MAKMLSKSVGFSPSVGFCRETKDSYSEKGFLSVRSVKNGRFWGQRLVLGDQRGNFRKQAVSVKMSLTIGKAMKWWTKGLQPNLKEIGSAQDLVDSLSNAGDKLVIVDFFSPGCGGCKALHPKICQFAEKNPDVLFLQVNYEEHKSMCYSLNVHVLPFFRFYRGAQGRVCSFSCTNATIKKFKDALAKHTPERCSLGPTKGLEESELLALAANKDLTFNYTRKPAVTAPNQDDMAEAAPAGPTMPVPRTSRAATQLSGDKILATSGR
ncbi:putative thioredoxin superfamily protein [Iris pallida]|uniref:Thioredoxin superfamily protein n=1 Tax=Iris pallida TaxID=29817 RepID=A0AAX6H604_IRIPA|nr:putative thioredoxin superfamily protein [Iris pallida]